MKIQKLRLSHFRNIERLQMTLAQRVCFFVGNNGQGKTNLLESLYLLSNGSSFRPGSLEHLIQEGTTSASVSISGVRSHGLPIEIQLKLARTAGTSRSQGSLGKELLLNGKKATSGEVPTVFSTVLFSPESLNSIKSGPESRRELVDSIIKILWPNGATRLREFARALKARNALLRTIAQSAPSAKDRATLASLTRVYLLLATEVTVLRTKTLQLLKDPFSRAVQWLLGDPRFAELEYVVSEEVANEWSEEETFDALSRRSSQLTGAEMSLGSTLVGPHKHELRFRTRSGQDARYCASQGQQRALILALKVAQIDLHRSALDDDPIILLDDVMSELDDIRRNRLVEYLSETNAQVLMTATDLTWPERMASSQSSIYFVQSGLVTDAVGATTDLRPAKNQRDVQLDV